MGGWGLLKTSLWRCRSLFAHCFHSTSFSHIPSVHIFLSPFIHFHIFLQSLIHPLIHPLIHSFILSFIHSFSHIPSVPNSSTHSSTHSFIHSFIHFISFHFIRSFIQPSQPRAQPSKPRAHPSSARTTEVIYVRVQARQIPRVQPRLRHSNWHCFQSLHLVSKPK